MPRFVELPSDYTDDGLDCVRGIAAALLINGFGGAIGILLWFLWWAA